MFFVGIFADFYHSLPMVFAIFFWGAHSYKFDDFGRYLEFPSNTVLSNYYDIFKISTIALDHNINRALNKKYDSGQ